MEKEKYTKPFFEVIYLLNEDIITESPIEEHKYPAECYDDDDELMNPLPEACQLYATKDMMTTMLKGFVHYLMGEDGNPILDEFGNPIIDPNYKDPEEQTEGEENTEAKEGEEGFEKKDDTTTTGDGTNTETETGGEETQGEGQETQEEGQETQGESETTIPEEPTQGFEEPTSEEQYIPEETPVSNDIPADTSGDISE